ncbi:MAG: EF-Tu/IF-2/RF-3 family GTPase [archaeon]
MKSLSIGIFTDSELSDSLAKKGTSSDITLYNKKTDDCIYTFIVPHSYPEKISSLIQTAQLVDAAVIVVDQITKDLGETILILDSLDMKNTFIHIKNPIDEQQLQSILNQTSLKYEKVSKEDLMQALDKINPEQKDTKTKIIIDHSFQVKSVGTVALGFLKSGTIKPYDKLTALPAKKEAMIKSIQMQSKNVDTASAPARVGLSLKGIDVEDLDRGTVLTTKDMRSEKTFRIKYKKCPFYKGEIKEASRLHLSVGMQFREITIKKIENNILTVESQKPFAIDENDRIILIDNSTTGLRLAARGNITL